MEVKGPEKKGKYEGRMIGKVGTERAKEEGGMRLDEWGWSWRFDTLAAHVAGAPASA